MKNWLLSYYNPYFCSMNTQLHQLPKLLKYTLVVFLITLSFGYLSGVDLVKHTTDFKAQGIEQNILGDELDETAEELHFKMSEKQLHNIIHSHVISLSMLFLLLSLLLFFTHYPAGLKSFLMIEPMLSLITTFGGLWLLWKGVLWIKYLVMISGLLMHLSLVGLVGLLLYALLFKK